MVCRDVKPPLLVATMFITMYVSDLCICRTNQNKPVALMGFAPIITSIHWVLRNSVALIVIRSTYSILHMQRVHVFVIKLQELGKNESLESVSSDGLTVPVPGDRSMEHSNMITDKRKSKFLQKGMLTITSSTTNLICNNLGLNPDLKIMRPVANRLSCDMSLLFASSHKNETSSSYFVRR